jgi:pimeloyl-ACP methyl ester carboxylesterase
MNKTLRHPLLRLALVVATLCVFAACASPRGQDLATSPGSAEINGVVLDYGILGSGKPLLMLTGYAMTREMWDAKFIAELARQRQVILMDNRGMGASRLGDDDPFSIADMARDAALLLDALGFGRADVLGWSMGGMVAQELALSRPDKVCSLVLVASTPVTGPLEPTLERLNRMSPAELRGAMFPADWISNHPGIYQRITKRPRPPDMDVVGRQYQAMLAWTGTVDRLGSLRVPVLLLAGSEDWVCPPELSRRMFESLPEAGAAGGGLTVIDLGSHWMMHQFPEKLAGEINAFLSNSPCR